MKEMMSKETLEGIEIVRRMDLKVAVPTRFVPKKYTPGAISSEVEVKHVHVPSLFTAYEVVIRDLQSQIADMRRKRMAKHIPIPIKFNKPPRRVFGFVICKHVWRDYWKPSGEEISVCVQKCARCLKEMP